MGRLDLGHSESDIFNLNLRAEFNQALGVESKIIAPEEIPKKKIISWLLNSI